MTDIVNLLVLHTHLHMFVNRQQWAQPTNQSQVQYLYLAAAKVTFVAFGPAICPFLISVWSQLCLSGTAQTAVLTTNNYPTDRCGTSKITIIMRDRLLLMTVLQKVSVDSHKTLTEQTDLPALSWWNQTMQPLSASWDWITGSWWEANMLSKKCWPWFEVKNLSRSEDLSQNQP